MNTNNDYIIADTKIENVILNMKLTDLRCKHVFNLSSEKSRKVLKESTLIGYKYCLWGTYSKTTAMEYQLNKILKMEEDNYNHKIRIIVIKYDFCEEPIIWTDNLHSTIKYIRQFGEDVKLKDIPFYLVDYSEEKPAVIIYDYKNSLIRSEDCIKGIVDCTIKRKEWSNSKPLIDVNYLLSDFKRDNPQFFKQ